VNVSILLVSETVYHFHSVGLYVTDCELEIENSFILDTTVEVAGRAMCASRNKRYFNAGA